MNAVKLLFFWVEPFSGGDAIVTVESEQAESQKNEDEEKDLPSFYGLVGETEFYFAFFYVHEATQSKWI